MYMGRSSEVLSDGSTNGSTIILLIEELLPYPNGSKTAFCKCPDLSPRARHLQKIRIE
jgi:hypothetical protein